jgi:hypothetical protein
MVGEHYGGLLNTSLLLSGAILHDIGKIFEFTKDAAPDYTTLGRLLGHLSYGAIYITELAKEMPDFPEEKLLLLQHMLISHHGEPSMGSPVTPKFLEAIALHFLDNLDGKLFGVADFIKKEGERPRSGGQLGWTTFNKLLNSFYLKTPDFKLVGSDAEVPSWGNAALAEAAPVAPAPVAPDAAPVEPSSLPDDYWPTFSQGELGSLEETDDLTDIIELPPYDYIEGPLADEPFASSTTLETEEAIGVMEPIGEVSLPEDASFQKMEENGPAREPDTSLQSILQPIAENAEEPRPVKKTRGKTLPEDLPPIAGQNRLF